MATSYVLSTLWNIIKKLVGLSYNMIRARGSWGGYRRPSKTAAVPLYITIIQVFEIAIMIRLEHLIDLMPHIRTQAKRDTYRSILGKYLEFPLTLGPLAFMISNIPLGSSGSEPW